MSLIYDYLKIDGKAAAGNDVTIEIPPALLKGDDESPVRFNKQPFLILLAACFIIGILILSLDKINPTRQELKGPTDQESSSSSAAAISTPETLVPHSAQVPAETEPVEEAEVVYEKSSPSSAAFNQPLQVITPEIIQVFPEPEVDQPPAVIQKTGGTIAVEAETAASADMSAVIEPPKPAESPARQPAPESVPGVQLYAPAKLKAATPAKGKKYYQAGLLAQQRGDLRIAEIFYKKALADSPAHMNSMINLSAIYVQQERYREAEEILWEILGYDKLNSKALVNLGVINLYKGKNTAAEEYFQQAIQANPQEENGLVNLAYLAEQKEDHAAAEKYYRQLLQVNPANMEALLAYGYILEQQERYPQALEVYQESLELEVVQNNRELFAKVLERRNQIARELQNPRQ